MKIQQKYYNCHSNFTHPVRINFCGLMHVVQTGVSIWEKSIYYITFFVDKAKNYGKSWILIFSGEVATGSKTWSNIADLAVSKLFGKSKMLIYSILYKDDFSILEHSHLKLPRNKKDSYSKVVCEKQTNSSRMCISQAGQQLVILCSTKAIRGIWSGKTLYLKSLIH